MYEIGFALPIVVIIVGAIFLIKSAAEQSYYDNEINKLVEENSRRTKEYFNNAYGDGTIK